jgi:hypothetical protein
MIALVPRTLPSLLAAVALLASAGLATAGAADEPLPLDTPLVADLDGDGAIESVRAHEVQCFPDDGPKPPPCEPGGLRSLFVEVADSCAGGPHTLMLSREMDFASLAEIVDADGDGHARELAFELRAGATARGVQAKVVRFRAGAGGCVEVQKTLFSYPRPETIGKRPKGTFYRTGFISLGNFDKTRKGLELRTDETYSRLTDPGCCPSFERVTTWTYVASRSGYRAYRTKLKKIPRPI